MKQTPACSCVSNSCSRQGFPRRIIITTQRISAAQHCDPRPSNMDPGPAKRERGKRGRPWLVVRFISTRSTSVCTSVASQIVPITPVPFFASTGQARVRDAMELNFDVWPCCTNHWAAAVTTRPALLTFLVASHLHLFKLRCAVRSLCAANGNMLTILAVRFAIRRRAPLET
ncbi:hypothetical protein J3F84DRAFT_363504 [Trichoderma pleuroticola]